MSRRRGFSKKRRFCRFFVVPSKKFSTGCHSDNFDPRTSAYGSFESLCPKFSKTHVKKVSISKIVGARPLRSQLIQNREPQKRCFFGIFWEKMLSHGQTVHFLPIVLYIFRKLCIWGFRKSGWNSIFDILWSVRFLVTGWDRYVPISRDLVIREAIIRKKFYFTKKFRKRGGGHLVFIPLFFFKDLKGLGRVRTKKK